MSTTTEAAGWPRATATLNEDGTAEVSIGGTVTEVAAGDVDEARAQVVAIVAARAQQLGRPLRVLTRDPAGEWPLIIHPDETVMEDDSREPRPQTVEPAAVAPTPAEPVSTEPPQAGPGSWVSAAAPAAQGTELPTRRAMRQSFLVREQIEEPATTGWRGLVTRAGIRMSPSEEERAERADVLAVSQHWPGPRTIAIVNGKGGAGKTPSTVLLSGVFARYGGAGVLAWDNNQTRGTLGWRTEQGPHESTLLELLPQVDRLLSTSAQSADLAHYVHHQTRDRFDVLRSKPMVLAQEQRVEPEDVDAIHAVASKYYRLIFIDSGNDESDPMWLRMIDHADQLVVATTTRDDHAEAGALLLEALAERDERSAHLADSAVVIVTQADPKATPADMQRVATGYRDLTREAVTIPFDQAMVDGVLHYGALRPTTQRAWLAAAAAVARGL
ncbi:AAA family ATPase (plasmid) [Streptomyces sp. L7]|uniref:MinD/ParA family ATP-binding protein n=1 Tax=Actinomycetes TaxID=1760 RepID=UPI00389ACAB5